MSAHATMIARLEAYKTQKLQGGHPALAAPADGLRSPPSLTAAAQREASPADQEPVILRAQQFLQSQAGAERVAEPDPQPEPELEPEPEPKLEQEPESGDSRGAGRRQLSVDLIRDESGFGVDYTVTADSRLIVVSCSCRPAAGQTSPTPGLEIVGLAGQAVKGNAEALYAALDSIRDEVPIGETVEWTFEPPQAALGDATKRLADSMAAHLAPAGGGESPPPPPQNAHLVSADADETRRSGKSRVELQREWRHNAVWDIESGLWASPFFGAFSALRFFSLALLGQLLLIIVAVYTTDGLAFPGWIVFSLAMATVATGFPGWWEPMTNKHLRLHMIVACISAVVTLYLAVFMRDRYATGTVGQREKVASLHIGIAALQLLGCLFSWRAQAHALQVDDYIRARLEEEQFARKRALSLHRLPFERGGSSAERDIEDGVRDGLLWALDYDGEAHDADYMQEDHSIFDPDLRRLDARLRQTAAVSGEMYEKNSLLAQVLNQNEKKNRKQLEEMQTLARTAVEAQAMCERATAKLNYFETELRGTTRRAAELEKQLLLLQQKSQQRHEIVPRTFDASTNQVNM